MFAMLYPHLEPSRGPPLPAESTQMLSTRASSRLISQPSLTFSSCPQNSKQGASCTHQARSCPCVFAHMAPSTIHLPLLSRGSKVPRETPLSSLPWDLTVFYPLEQNAWCSCLDSAPDSKLPDSRSHNLLIFNSF